MGTKDLTHEAIARALTNGDLLTHEQRSVLLGLVADDKVWQRKHDALCEALHRVHKWGALSPSYSYTIAHDVKQWFEAGACGELPPLPDYATKA